MTSTMADELRDVVAAVTRDVVPEPGRLPVVWPHLVETGLPLIGIPEHAGGSGGQLGDLVVVLRELGRAGVSTPLIETNAARLLLGASAPPGALPVVAVDGRLEDGVLHAVVPWARHASLLLVHVPGAGWRVVEPAAAAIVAADNVAGEPRDAVTAVRHEPLDGPDLRPRLDLLWAAAVTGAADTTLRMTHSYVSGRTQFGEPLLAIPAVQAGVARMRVALLQADTVVRRAAERATEAESEWNPGSGSGSGSAPTVARAASVARIVTAQAATEIARLAHQLHGAIGITAEYGLGRYTTRLLAWRDTVTTERAAARAVGAAVRAGGESALWDEITG